MLSAVVRRSVLSRPFVARRLVDKYHSTARRALSVSHYEYPNRTEMPEITRTLAADAVDDDRDKTSASPERSPSANDLFDDARTLSSVERDRLRDAQRSSLRTALDPQHRVLPEAPSFVPPNAERSSLSIPRVEATTLSSGLRVTSQETYGQVCTVGVVCDFGSRYEDDTNTGVNHMIELLAFNSTAAFSSASDIVERMDRMGGATFATSGREQTLYCVDVLRPNVGEALHVLAETILRPRVTPEEVEECRAVMGFQHEEWYRQGGVGTEVALGEGLQIAAYSPLENQQQQQQQLGRPHFCPAEALGSLSSDAVERFRRDHLTPDRMVLAASGIEHAHLVELAETHFGEEALRDLLSSSSSDISHPRTPSVYTGGEYRLALPSVSPVDPTRVALAFELPHGWHATDDLVPACVLQTLLGGGNSFSAGGPGKGMYSRLYREVLNRFYWAESAEAFTSFHHESGLVGMSGSTHDPERASDLLRVLAEQCRRLSDDLVSDEELDRAKNMLRCNVLTQLESRLVLFEDLGRQTLTYGKREDVPKMCARIDAVTADDLRRVSRTMMTTTSSNGGNDALRSRPPTLCAVGATRAVESVDSWEDVKRWFQ